MKVTNVLVKDIYPSVAAVMPKRYKQYKDNIKKFIEARAEDLYDIAPFKRLPFGATDRDDFFNAVQISMNDINSDLHNTYYWNMNFNPRAAKDEFTVTLMMIIRYFILTGKEMDAELSAIYLAFSGKFYPSIHSQKFKIPPDKHREVMEYVVNEMLTQKFDLKREGSLFGAVRSICKTWLDTYKAKFKDPDDEDVADMIQQLHGRIKSFLGNIASLYYKVYNDKDKYLVYSSDSSEEDSFRIADSDSLKIERAVENSMTWITSRSVDFRLCKMASDTNVKVDEVKSIIESIQDDRDNLVLIRELLQIMISEYMVNGKEKDVTSPEFISMTIVAKPNTKNKNIIRQKEIIEGWLDENSPQYRKRKSRAQTKTSYHCSVLKYYALVVNAANK